MISAPGNDWITFIYLSTHLFLYLVDFHPYGLLFFETTREKKKKKKRKRKNFTNVVFFVVFFTQKYTFCHPREDNSLRIGEWLTS